ncbi:MAG: histidine phosphatase family protein [Micrococcales bacterium]|nr:histidine phosphatase family protein [Micrococcales bacterium]
MPGLNLVLWRHGLTSYNVEGRMQGSVDVGLNDLGHWQARTAAAALTARYEVSAIVSSDLSRARQTAEYLARTTGLPVTTDERLRERDFGDWEGLTRTEIAQRWPGEFQRWWEQGEHPDGIGGETRDTVARRYAAAVTDHAAALGRGTLVVVSHGTATGAGAGLLLGAAPDWPALISMRNAHWAHLFRDRADTRWLMHGYNLGPTEAATGAWDAPVDR